MANQSDQPLNIAIVGAGISGLVCAYLLSRQHQVTVFEKGKYLGGHTNTIDVDDPNAPGGHLPVDTGFIVFNERNYPHFCKLLKQLDVDSQASDMSFAVSCEKTGLEYNGTNFNKLFAQRKNVFRPSFWSMLREIVRFNQAARSLAQAGQDPTGQSVDLDDDFPLSKMLEEGGYSKAMIDRYLVPMGAAIWSTDTQRFLDFPARFLAEFLDNHGMLDMQGRPQWRTITGGSREYVRQLTQATSADFQLNTQVESVKRESNQVVIQAGGQQHLFDHVVMACHSDQALTVLADASEDEYRALSAIGYQPNTAVLHTDIAMMPRTKRAWAAWNYKLPTEAADRVTVTYNMNILQNLQTPTQHMVSLNPAPGQIAEDSINRIIHYHHPLYTTDRFEAHRRFEVINHHNRTSFCGAYWGHGFHEDGVKSALRVCQVFGETL